MAYAMRPGGNSFLEAAGCIDSYLPNLARMPATRPYKPILTAFWLYANYLILPALRKAAHSSGLP